MGRIAGVLLLLLLLPAASAQGIGEVLLTLRPPTAPIQPEIEAPTFIARVTVSCADILARAPAPSFDGVPVTFLFQAASGVVVTGQQTNVIDAEPCLGGMQTATLSVPFRVSIPRTAPGLEPIPATGQARLEAGGSAATPAIDSQTVPFTVTADANFLSEVRRSSNLQDCADGQARYKLELINYGNVRTRFTFEFGTVPSGDGWSARLPDPIVLDRPNPGDGKALSEVVPFVVDCPSGNSEGAYQLVIRPMAADDPSKAGDPHTANMLARARPFDGTLDASAGPWVLVAVLVAALLARRRA